MNHTSHMYVTYIASTSNITLYATYIVYHTSHMSLTTLMCLMSDTQSLASHDVRHSDQTHESHIRCLSHIM